MIFIYDVFTDVYDEKYKLNPYELYLYCYLYRNRSHDYTVNMSVDTIHKCTVVRFHNSIDAKNRQMIKDCLLSLREKGIIEFDCDKDTMCSRTGNSIGLNIRFKTVAEKKGFLQLPYDQFDAATCLYEFYIRVSVERFNNVTTAGKYGGRWISEKEFADLLGVSKRTFRNYADEMINDEKLYRMSGKWDGESRKQDKNIYKTVPFGNEDKIIVEEDIEYDPKFELDTIDGDIPVEDLRYFAENSAWGKENDDPRYTGSKKKILYDDYKYYKMMKEFRVDKKFVMMCEQIIKIIGKDKFIDYERKYEEAKNG